MTILEFIGLMVLVLVALYLLACSVACLILASNLGWDKSTVAMIVLMLAIGFGGLYLAYSSLPIELVIKHKVAL